jgi:Glycosyl transferase 4-like domain
MRNVLLIAFHFPPIQGSSGVQRTLRFAQDLGQFGWNPTVLTIVPSAYDSASNVAGNEIPQSVTVYRAFGLNVRKRLSILGRFPRMLALPDEWSTWRTWAVRKAKTIVANHSIDVIWSTYPITTAHTIGSDIARRHNIPWIAEFRDPMWWTDFPTDARQNQLWRRIEDRTFASASRVVVTAPGAAAVYHQRYPDYPRQNLVTIENGFDEETFLRAETAMQAQHTAMAGTARPVVLLHSGIVYTLERDPTHFFAAIAALKSSGHIGASDLQVVLRASGNESMLSRQIRQLAIDDIIRLEPPLSYLDAIQEMLRVDGLLVLQAANSNVQIPAKLYEYFRARRPIIALTDPAGDTAQLLSRSGAGIAAPLDSQEQIKAALMVFISQVRLGKWKCLETGDLVQYSRLHRTRQLAALFDTVI